MDQAELPTFILESLRSVAVHEGIENARFEPKRVFTNGFIAIVQKFRIVGENRNLSVVLKVLPNDDKDNDKNFSFKLFQREVLIYKVLLPEFQKIQTEFGLKFGDEKGFWAYPKCFYAEFNKSDPRKSSIVLEDLTKKNFSVRSPSETMDIKHTEKVFIELAKLHAISFVLKAKKPEVFAKFASLTEMMCPLMNSEENQHYCPRNIQLAADTFSTPEESHIRDKILSFKYDLWDKVELLASKNPNSTAVVCHGDCWISNTMFQYDGTGKVEKMVLIDWQHTKCGSGPSELINWLMCSCSRGDRANHKTQLLKRYYETLSTTLELFLLDVTEVLPYEQIVEQLRVYGLLALGVAIFGKIYDCKYPAKLFEDKNAVLTEEEKRCVANYNETMRGIVIDLIAMGSI